MTAAETGLPLREDHPHNLDSTPNTVRIYGRRATDKHFIGAPKQGSLGQQQVKRLKIALLGYRSHPFVGGQGIYIKYLSRALTQLGHRVEVFSGPPYPELDANIPLIKIPSLDLFEAKDHTLALRPKHLLSWADFFEWWSMLSGGFAEPYTFGRRVKKRLLESDYDIIHDNQSLSFALLDLQKAGLKVTSTIHHPIHRDRDIALAAAKKWGDRLLIRRWYSFLGMQEKVVSQLHHVSTVSRASQRDIGTFFSRSAKQTPVIPNGVDTETFRPLPSVARQPLRIITTSSSDQPLKGLRYLLEAVDTVRGKFPQVHLRIIGKLKEGGSSAKLIQKLDLSAHVSCIDGISTEDLVNEYAQASVAVCPSLYEGFGLPVAEAMACSLPVVSSDGGALPEVVGDAGAVVAAGDSRAIADQLTAFFLQPDDAQTLGLKARNHILENFSWQKVAVDLSLHYQDILARANN